MNKYKAASAAIVTVVVLAVVAGIVQQMQSSKNDMERAVSQEFITCLSAICLDKSPGHQCLESEPKISKITVAEDATVRGAKRIIIETSDRSCGTSIYRQR